MKSEDERSRLAAHVLLDMVSAVEADFDQSPTNLAVHAAFERLNDIDASKQPATTRPASCTSISLPC